MMDAAAVRAGMDVTKISPHKLRHAFVMALVEGGRSLDEVRDLRGHASIATTPTRTTARSAFRTRRPAYRQDFFLSIFLAFSLAR